MASSISIRPSSSYLSFSLPLQHPLRPPDSIRRNGRPLFLRPSAPAPAPGLLLLDQSEASKPNRLKSPYVDHLLPPLLKDHEEQPTFEAMLASEALITGEEAVIAAAAAEAIAFAKAAVEVAQDAVQIAHTIPTLKMEKTDDSLFEAEFLQFERSMLTDSEQLTAASNSAPVGNQLVEENVSVNESKNSSPTDSELELLRMQLSESIAVRSARQTERRARRERAAEKVASNVISVKPASSTRRKRSTIQPVDYSDPLRYLRDTASTSKLLTATEELELSEGIQDLLKLERLREEVTDRYGEQPTIAQWAAAAGIDQKTLRKRLNYGIHCRDKIIKSNIRLVISIAKNYQGSGMSLQDLVQEGCRGLLKGAEKFDGSKGFKFSTYAHWWIKQAVRRFLSDQSRTIRLPFHMVDATYRVREARKQLYDENRRQPDNEEVAEVAGLSMKRLTAVLLTPKAPRSLDRKIGIDDSLKPSEVIADPHAETGEEMLKKQFMKKDLEKALDSLNPREKQVVRWRFGLEDGRMRTLQEIGELMGVSRERVRQVESCAFRKLRNRRRTNVLSQYLIP